MQKYGRPEITAVLGPTNTGKTHLAVERMLAHSSGMIGFPLRLLAREVYDRVARMRGPECVALVTGEERIWPATARYLMCTAEAMPLRAQAHDTKAADAPRDVAFVALDEAQLAQDHERGHVFTTRLLKARGREETMLLGSGALAPVFRRLVPDAEITTRPRFSTLTYDGPRKLRRLPPRTAIIAFSADEVYAIAEALRRISGGASVVMGALSPATRNAQVAMFQSGEVDYLVATDAVGMGLNLQVEHVAFASLNKFDGQRSRRLTVAEMAQIAGRAGRHQRDGTFGFVGAESAFTPEEISAIEDHRFDPIEWIYWRNPDPSMDSVSALITDLQMPPDNPALRPAPLASDLDVLQHLAADADAMAPVDGPDMVRRFRDVCSLPDFRRLGPEAHRRLVARIWADAARGSGHVDTDWFAGQLARLDVADGTIETLADRIAAVRSFCYMAHRSDWVADPSAMAADARAVEGRLSDALHNALTARFVDRRTTVLLRGLGQDATALPVIVADDGAVSVDGAVIGSLNGFVFTPDAASPAGDRRMLLAAAEKYLTVELARRASMLAGSNNSFLTLRTGLGSAPTIVWHDHVVGTLVRGKHLLSPRVVLHPGVAALDAHVGAAVQARLSSFVDETIGRFLRPMVTLASHARDALTPAAVRAVAAALVDGCGVAPRVDVAESLRSASPDERHMLRQLGIRVGYLDLFMPLMLKPRPLEWLTALRAAWRGIRCMARLPDSVFMTPHTGDETGELLGFRLIGGSWLRVDLVEKIAKHAHEMRMAAAAAPDQSSQGNPPDGDGTPAALPPRPGAFRIDPALATSLDLPLADRLLILRALDFVIIDRPAQVTTALEPQLWWQWKRAKPRGAHRRRSPGNASAASSLRAPDRAGRETTKGDGSARVAAAQQNRGAKQPRERGGPRDRPSSGASTGQAPATHDDGKRGANPFAALASLFDAGDDSDGGNA